MSSDEPVIEREWTDAAGRHRVVAPEVVDLLRGVIGEPASSRGPLIVRPGGEVTPGTVTLEDGGSLDVGRRLPADVPLGHHRIADDEGERVLVVSPGTCHLPDDRSWGWAVQLYASRSRSSWGMGDLADLGELARWSAGEGARFLMVNPLHAAAPGEHQQASPYSPTSRRFRAPLYISVERAAAGLTDADDARRDVDDLAALGRHLNDDRVIDRDRVQALKMRALQRIWRHRTESDAQLLDEQQQRLGRDRAAWEFAVWCSLAEDHGPSWREWPVQLRRPTSPAVARHAVERSDRVAFYAWLQELADQQMADASASTAIVQDLPIGFDHGGADAWAWQDLLAEGVSVGAPPDEFNTAGQDWGLPPFVPWKLRQADYLPFTETVRATMSTGGGLRIDHVAGLFRLWWIPEGGGPADGAYVRYPAGDLLDLLALESVRRRAVVVGEDLGTVPPGVREQLAERSILSYRLLWFEPDPPARWPQRAMAAVSTHDLPTVAGLWDGSDLEALAALGIDPQREATLAIRRRLADAARLADDAPAEAAVAGAYDLIATAPSLMLCATLDDAMVVPERPNVPGAPPERLNWCLALPRPIEELASAPAAAAIATSMNEAVTSTAVTSTKGAVAG